VTAVRLLDELPRHPMVTIPTVVKLLQTTKPTATKAVGVLEQLRVLQETTGRRRDRTFSYAAYLERLRIGTEI
jgi:Fic family protein